MKFGGFLVALALLPGPAIPGPAVADTALAGPQDEFAQGAYLTLLPGAVRLELELSPGAGVVAPVLAQLDPDRDGQISEADAGAYGAWVMSRLSLTLDGDAAEWDLRAVRTMSYDDLANGDGAITLAAEVVRPDAPGPHRMDFRNGYDVPGALYAANVFVAKGAGYVVDWQRRSEDGRDYAVTFRQLH